MALYRAADAMTSLDQGEQAAEDFLKKYGLRPERFSKVEMRRTKTPDFRVFRSYELVLYCEAKHVQRDDWLDRQMKNARPLELVGGLRPDPIFNRLTDRIHEAAKQLAAVNGNREYPNILVFANSDRTCSFADLLAVLEGNFYCEGGAAEPIYKQYSEGRIKEEKRTIDLYVWKDDWPGCQRRESLFFNRGSKHYQTLCGLLDSDPTAHRQLS
jgi:hypothetical protein